MNWNEYERACVRAHNILQFIKPNRHSIGPNMNCTIQFILFSFICCVIFFLLTHISTVCVCLLFFFQLESSLLKFYHKRFIETNWNLRYANRTNRYDAINSGLILKISIISGTKYVCDEQKNISNIQLSVNEFELISSKNTIRIYWKGRGFPFRRGILVTTHIKNCQIPSTDKTITILI